MVHKQHELARMSPDLRDPKEFDRAYVKHGPAMVAAATRVLRDAAAAEDVVQDVFVRLWREPETFNPARGNLSSYLTMTARSRAIDGWRSRSVREAAIERSGTQERLERPVAEDAAEPVIRRDGQQRVLRALGTLPEKQREAVLLAFGKGLTAREIATAADVPLGTIKGRVRLGLDKARTELATAA